MANNFLATANRVAAHLGKAPKDFTKEDIIRVVQDFDIRMVNLMYPGGDGRLKTLNFMLNSADYLNTILTCGERVDGSSLFSSIEAASSDLYVMPVFRTAFIDPFQEIPTLCLRLLRPRRPAAGLRTGAHAQKGHAGLPQSHGHGIPGHGRAGVLRHQGQ